MTYSSRPTWVDIDLPALIHNMKQASAFCSESQRVLAVVKADAYGHGAVPVAKALRREGIADFAVATLEEALELRTSGIDDPLLILGGCFAGQEQAFIDHDLMPALFDEETAVRLNRTAQKNGRRVRVHLKVDSGMGRVGFLEDQLGAFLPRLKCLNCVEVEGFMSHLACADDLDSGVTEEQRRRFLTMLEMVRAAGLSPREIHLNNSAGLSAWGGSECTLFRPGIMLYGGLPGAAFAQRLDLKPVMHLRSCVAQLRQLPAGSGLSYGHTYHAEKDIKLAVLPIGYADGFNRLLSNRTYGILNGHRVPQVGRVCMDWTLFDVSAVDDVKIGDPITLLGEADGLTLSGDDWAQRLGTIPYEVFCRIGQRVPRRYGAGGR